MLTLQSLLDSQTDLLKGAKVKLVRHKDERPEYRDLLKQRDTLIEYQAYQRRAVYNNCDYIISFVGQMRRRSLLFGVFKVNGVQPAGDHFQYDLEEITSLSHLNDRVVIDWGATARSWVQWYERNPKEIVEIMPAGYLGQFPGLLDFVLDHEELKRLIANPEANADWKHHLSAVNGIYLITDHHTGRQYIGSACGNEGIWQRWSNYAQQWHGGNRELIGLYDKDPNHQRHFTYSVLQTLPSNLTQREVVAIENLYKQKLGTRAHGLNAN